MRSSLLILSLVLGVAPPARADIDYANLARLGVQRARRSVALGPHLGATAVRADGGSYDAAISFGVALSWFDVPVVPDPATIASLVGDHARARVARLARQAALDGKELTPSELEALARQVYRDVVAEFVEERRPKTLEEPKLRVFLEGARTLDSDDWSIRAGGGIGIAVVSLVAAASVHFADDTALYLGPELGVQLLPRASVRSPVVDLFVRADVAVAGDGPWLLGAGLRVILDVI